MNVDQGSLAAVFTGLKATFVDALAQVKPIDVDALIATVPSVTGTEVYPVAALLGRLREVLDEVTISNIGRFVQSVPNRDFGHIVEIKRDDIADDQIGLYKIAVAGLTKSAAVYHEDLAVEALAAGFAQVWGPDGQFVYSNTHVWPGGQAWDNLEPAVALAGPTFDAACLRLETRLGPDQQPMKLKPTHLICGPANRAAAENIVQIQYLVGGGSNRLYHRCDLIVVPGPVTNLAWGVVDASGVKPLLLQNRQPVEFTAQDDPKADNAFYRNMYGYKVERRCAVAILAPWLMQVSAGA